MLSTLFRVRILPLALLVATSNPRKSIYVDGQLVATSNASGNIRTRNNVLNIGKRNNDRFLIGSLDELRISDISRSADWIETDYNSQFQPISYPAAANDFYSIGSESSLAACDYSMPDYTTSGAAGGGSGTITITQSPVAGTAFTAATTVTLTATDASSQTATCTFVVTPNDPNPPTAICQDITVALSGGSYTMSANEIDNGSSDDCDTSPSFGASQTSFGAGDVGDNTVTLTVSDDVPNTATCVATVTVTGPPNITCPPDQNILASASSSSFLYEREITINSGRVAGTSDLSNFPMRFSFTDNDLRSTANGGKVESANGYDISFFDASDALLDHQIESYDPVNGTIEAWVRIPTLDYNNNTVLFLRYGNSGVATDPSTTGVWDANYAAVWHLGANEDDATSNNNDGTNNGSSNATGFIGDGQEFNEPDEEWISVPNSTSLNLTGSEVTLEAWVYCDPDENPDDSPFIMKGGGNPAYMLGINGGSGAANDINTRIRNSGNTNFREDQYDITANTWMRIVMTYDANLGSNPRVRLYVDGQEVGDDNANGTLDDSSGDPLRIGKRSNDRWFDGILDELRVSNVARSADWLETDYNSQFQPISYPADANDFYSVSAEQPLASCEFSLSDYTSLAAAAGGTGTLNISQSPASGTAITAATVVTLTVTDGSGTTDDCTFTVTPVDDVDPNAICQDITVTLNGSGSYNMAANEIDNGSSDNCDTSPTFGASQTSFTNADLGANTITLTVSDDRPNTATCTAIVTVLEPLDVTCPPDETIFTATAGIDFNYERPVIINAARVAGSSNLSSFPMRFSWTDNDLRTVANGGKVESANGYDIIFYDDSGNRLDHQMESYDGATGNFEGWVRIPV
ncbi:MAG: DUF2341 domain-containing protein, partial [Bacteroidota bacterium]